MRPQRFALALLRTMGYPETDNNLKSVLAWIGLEGGHYHNGALYNPLNTTQSMPGARSWSGTVPIKIYSSWQEGLDATVKTLNYGAYSAVRAGLALSRSPEEVHQAIKATPWGTKNYQAGSAEGLANSVLRWQDPHEGQGGDFAILGGAGGFFDRLKERLPGLLVGAGILGGVVYFATKK